MSDRPPFLNNACVRRTLNRFLDKLDNQTFEERSNRLVETIDTKHFPELYSPKEPGEDDVTWHHLRELEAHGVISFERTRKRGLSAVASWEHTRIVALPAGEALIREWLGRPVVDEEMARWQKALIPHLTAFREPGLIRPGNLGRLAQYDPGAVIERLASIPKVLSERSLTLYQLSAQLFWGDSKALRGKEKLIDQLFDIQVAQWLARPVLIEGTYRHGCDGVLIVENMDTFVAASTGQIKSAENLTILYAQGFKGTTSRIRTQSMARFYWSDSPFPDPQWLFQFQQAWFSRSEFPVPIYYFGDLDPAGLTIYRHMRQIFPEIQPWKTGYNGLVEALKRGDGHPMNFADKGEQGLLPDTGCSWMDSCVTPVMKQTNLCVDQEYFQD
ncbi:hypothetical protein [Marinobacter sp. Arc7-DN-1]|uniref:hypothetical protein n=1 Tax=Marinobacter sp. Arc7-DN-1 TaxID=2304594 RepID=UPI000E44D17E|nr:hypothetical protein [Marinobacter sp. Arc7-DN-1]AXS81912.1 hypothetical protein D0851_01950 [Marinobacter sp. Arc7-DN-1]